MHEKNCTKCARKISQNVHGKFGTKSARKKLSYFNDSVDDVRSSVVEVEDKHCTALKELSDRNLSMLLDLTKTL